MSTFLFCLIVADFITGVAHWFEDTYGLPTWPLLGKQVIIPNIDHHKRPGVIGSMSNFVSRNYLHGIPLAIIAVALYFWWWPAALTVVFMAMGNEVHAWSHQAKPNWFVSLLQEMCIVQTPYHHGKHHREPYDKYFCVLTNLVNPVLERIHFWSSIEWCISQIGIHPKRMSKERDGV